MTPRAGPPRREPVFNLPRVVTGTLLLLLAVHAWRDLLLADESGIRLLLDLALVPARWSLALDPSSADAILREAGESAMEGALARYVVADADPKWWTALTYAGLHGSWGHVLLNGVWLAAFGTPVARRCGAARFLGLAALASLGGGIAHVLLHPTSVLPLIGASAGVSGLMAGASRFIFADDDARPPAGEGGALRVQSIGEVVTNRRAATFLVVWFATNVAFGLFAAPLGVVDASIAWEAHIGGFVTGFLVFPWLDRAMTGTTPA